VSLKELVGKVDSRQLKVESKASRPGGGGAFDSDIIVIFQGLFYHTGT